MDIIKDILEWAFVIMIWGVIIAVFINPPTFMEARHGIRRKTKADWKKINECRRISKRIEKSIMDEAIDKERYGRK